MGQNSEKHIEIREQEEMANDVQRPINIKLVDTENITHEGMQTLSDLIVNRVRNGELKALEAFIKVDFLQKALTKAKDAIKKEASEEAESYGNGEFLLGVEIAVKERGVRYDYSNNSEWTQLKSEMDVIQDDMKKAALSKHKIITDDGEVILPAIKTSTTSVELKYKKVS